MKFNFCCWQRKLLRRTKFQERKCHESLMVSSEEFPEFFVVVKRESGDLAKIFEMMKLLFSLSLHLQLLMFFFHSMTIATN